MLQAQRDTYPGALGSQIPDRPFTRGVVQPYDIGITTGRAGRQAAALAQPRIERVDQCIAKEVESERD